MQLIPKCLKQAKPRTSIKDLTPKTRRQAIVHTHPSRFLHHAFNRKLLALHGREIRSDSEGVERVYDAPAETTAHAGGYKDGSFGEGRGRWRCAQHEGMAHWFHFHGHGRAAYGDDDEPGLDSDVVASNASIIQEKSVPPEWLHRNLIAEPFLLRPSSFIISSFVVRGSLNKGPEHQQHLTVKMSG